MNVVPGQIFGVGKLNYGAKNQLEAMKPPKPIPRATPQRKKELAKYRRLKADYLARYMICLKCGNYVRRDERELHHIYGRSGRLLTWVPGFAVVHGLCHYWIETHRNEAVKLGLRAPDNLWNRPSLIIPKSP